MKKKGRKKRLERTFGDVQIEEVTVKDGLNDTSNDGNHVIESFRVVTVDPV